MSTTTPDPDDPRLVTDSSRDAGLTAWIARLYAYPGMLRMGHNQCAEDLNLGLGWIYYGLARLARPARAVVIGSWRGFVPMVIARACQDNRDPGAVTFIDPSLVDEFWKDPAATDAHFRSFGLGNVRHHLATTQQFVATDDYRRVADVGLLFIDGYHTAEQARFDYRAFEEKLAPRALVLFHDSMGRRKSGIYGMDRAYDVSVREFMAELRQVAGLQLLDLPFGTGLTIMRKVDPHGDEPLLEGREERS
jgi:predicted O-methyltransferase YrrM